MIDNQDKQTQPLDLGPEPKRRGRPAKQNALSNAERQRLYRERQKAQRNEKQESHAVPYEEVVGIAQELGERCKKAEARIKELEKQLAQRNEAEKRGKGLTYRKLTEYTLDQLQKNSKLADVKTAKDWSFGSYLLWQSLALTMNVQKAAIDKDQEKMRSMVGLS